MILVDREFNKSIIILYAWPLRTNKPLEKGRGTLVQHTIIIRMISTHTAVHWWGLLTVMVEVPTGLHSPTK